jgi:hypothetical protein
VQFTAALLLLVGIPASVVKLGWKYFKLPPLFEPEQEDEVDPFYDDWSARLKVEEVDILSLEAWAAVNMRAHLHMIPRHPAALEDAQSFKECIKSLLNGLDDREWEAALLVAEACIADRLLLVSNERLKRFDNAKVDLDIRKAAFALTAESMEEIELDDILKINCSWLSSRPQAKSFWKAVASLSLITEITFASHGIVAVEEYGYQHRLSALLRINLEPIVGKRVFIYAESYSQMWSVKSVHPLVKNPVVWCFADAALAELLDFQVDLDSWIDISSPKSSPNSAAIVKALCKRLNLANATFQLALNAICKAVIM